MPAVLPVPASRTALVTGASSGIGWETARLLAERGLTVVVHAPDAASGWAAVTRLVAAGVDAARLDLAVADFAHLAEVRAMAARVAEIHPVVDLLVNNAGDTAAEGAERVVRLCDPGAELVPGAYYDRTALSPAAPVAMEDRTVRRLLKLADKLVDAAS